MELTKEQLKKAYPELFSEIYNDGYSAGDADARRDLRMLINVDMQAREAGKTSSEKSTQTITYVDAAGEEFLKALNKVAQEEGTGTAQAEDADLRAEWERYPALREEFVQDFSSFVAFRKASAAGHVRIFGQKNG